MQTIMPSSRESLPPWEEKIIFYNCDIPLAQAYLYEKGLFPTGRCIGEGEGNRIFEIHPDPTESVWIDDGDLPDLRVMEIHADGNSVRLPPGKKGWSSLTLECEGYRVEMENIDVGEIARFMKRFDPDVILTDDGDASLLPFLFLAEQEMEDLHPLGPGALSREETDESRKGLFLLLLWPDLL